MLLISSFAVYLCMCACFWERICVTVCVRVSIRIDSIVAKNVTRVKQNAIHLLKYLLCSFYALLTCVFHKVSFKPYIPTYQFNFYIHIEWREYEKRKKTNTPHRTKRTRNEKNKNGWTSYYYAHTMTHIRISVAKREKNQKLHLAK